MSTEASLLDLLREHHMPLKDAVLHFKGRLGDCLSSLRKMRAEGIICIEASGVEIPDWRLAEWERDPDGRSAREAVPGVTLRIGSDVL